MEPPTFPTSGLQTVRAAPGGSAVLSLPLPTGTAPFLFQWSRVGASLDDRFTTSDDTGGVRLTVNSARVGDSGVYTLQASNVAGSDTARVRLEVAADEAPTGDDPPAFLRRLQDITVKVGTRTRFLVEIVSSTECKVTWYRNERRLMEAERVALVRDGNFWCADLAAVTVDDAGRWTCTAENLGGRASCSAHLNVLVPKAYKRPEFVEELRALLTEQGTVSLECKVVGVPTPVLRWFKDSREIKAGDVFALTANAEDPTSLGTYTCEAVNCMGRAYSSSKVHVVGRGSREGSAKPSSSGVAPEPPPIFTKELEDQFVRISERLSLSCHIVVPPWPRSVSWYNKEGKVEPSERYHVLEDGVGGYLMEVQAAEWCDEGEWKCVATSAGGRVGISSCYVSMDVPKNYRKPRFMENLQAVLTEEGLVSFECKVVGFPTPVLSWFKDGQELKPGDVYQLTGTNSLGSYCCIAKNCMGQASSSAELTVEDIQNQLNEEEKLQLFTKNQAPKFLQGLKSVEAKIDEPFRFTIKVAIPPEPSLLWYRDDQAVEESARCQAGKEDKGVFFLDIQHLEFVDQAEWKCVARNDFGHSVTSCFLKLIIPRHYKKPRFLENLQAILSDEGAVNLECKVIGVPQPTLKWYKDGEELKPGDIHRIISGQDGTCCLGTYTCEAQNCMGIAASSASLLGFDDSMKAKSKNKSEEQILQRNLSLSTIHEERTSQMYDTPIGDITLDDKGEISFSFDGKEVSVSLYETPDLTEEEALQIVEMYADQLSENVTEHNVVELPPLRFVKETSTSGNLLMEAIIIDVSPEYFVSPEEDLRTEADIEDISIADENAPPILSLDQDVGGEDYLEKTMAILSEEKSDFPKKVSRKKSDSQRSADDYFSLSRDQSLSEDKKDDDTQVLSESDMQSFASARSSGKIKSKSLKRQLSGEVPESSDVTKTMLQKEEVRIHKEETKVQNEEFAMQKEEIKKPPVEAESPAVKPKRERRSSRSSRRSSSGSEKSLPKAKEEPMFIEAEKESTTKKSKLSVDEFKAIMTNVSSTLSQVINDVQIIEKDIILKSELMSSAATASRSLEIISSLISPLSEIHSIADAATESIIECKEVSSSLFNSLPQPLKSLQQSLTIIEKCLDVESESKTLVKKTCVAFIEKCGEEIKKLMSELNHVTTQSDLVTDEKTHTDITSLTKDMTTTVKFSAETIKAKNLLSEASEIKVEEISVDAKHLKDTQKALFELKSPLNSLLCIAESANNDKMPEIAKVRISEIILADMAASIQDLQTALEQIETLSVKESSSSLHKYNTNIIEMVMESVVELRSSFEKLTTETKKDDEKLIVKQVLNSITENLQQISSHISMIENKVGSYDVLQSENKLEILQKMAQILISLENNLPRLEHMPEVKNHMEVFHKNLTKVLEKVIESNEAKKYFSLMEICDSVNRVNSSINAIESDNILSLACLNNTLSIIQDHFINNVFESELNCSILSNISDTLIGIQEAINHAEEMSMHLDTEHMQDLSIQDYNARKANIAIERIDHVIASINTVKSIEMANELPMSLTPILENICPVLEDLKRTIASEQPTTVHEEEHVSEISTQSFVETLATPLCELNQNLMVLNQTIVENVESLTLSSKVASTIAVPLYELYKTLQILQQDVISQYSAELTPYEISVNMASAVQNLQSCMVMIHEQAGVEAIEDMSTLEDISGIKTTAESLLSERLVLPAAEETAIEQSLEPFNQELAATVTAQALQILNEHITVLQNPEIVDALDTLSEVSDYSNLKSIALGLRELHSGIEEILHPVVLEGSKDIGNLTNISKLAAIAEPMQELQQSLSVLDTSNIPIYEQILELPSDKIHSVFQNISEFKEYLAKCMHAIFPAMETADKTIEISNKVEALRGVCENIKDIIQSTRCLPSAVPLSEEVLNLEETIDDLLVATDIIKGIKIDQVKCITEVLFEKVAAAQEELIRFTPQSQEKLAQEAKIIQNISEIENNIAVLEQYDFVDLSKASDITSCLSPQLAIEIQSDSLAQIDDIVDSAVNIVHNSQTQDTPLADLMILEDFFKTCKDEFTLIKCLITKQLSHKKIIRLVQEFNHLQNTINSFKTKQADLKLTEEMSNEIKNFLSHAEQSLNSIQKSLVKILDSQSEILFKTPLNKLNASNEVLKESLQNKKTGKLEEIINQTVNIIEYVQPSLKTAETDTINELLTPETIYTMVDEQIVVEKLEELLGLIEVEVTRADQKENREVLSAILSCMEKHQDYKDAIGTGKVLILLKCLSQCADILQANISQTKLQKLIVAPHKLEDSSLKAALSEMMEPLQTLQSQLTNVQEQIMSGIEEDSISVDITSTESIVQTMTDIHKEIVKQIESEFLTVDSEDVSLIMEMDKTIHTIQENLKSMEDVHIAQVVKEISKPIEDIEHFLHEILTSEKICENKEYIPTDVNSNVDSLENAVERFLNIEISELSGLFNKSDLKVSIELAQDIKNILSINLQAVDNYELVQKKNEKISSLKAVLCRYDWLDIDKYTDGKNSVELEALRRVFLTTYQLFAALENTEHPQTSINANEKEKSPVLLQHIEQYIELIETVGEESAIIKKDDLKQSVQLAREICENTACTTTNENLIKQVDLAQKLQKSLSRVHAQVLEKALEQSSLVSPDVLQNITQATVQLLTDLDEKTDVLVADQASQEMLSRSKDFDKENSTQSDISPESLISANTSEPLVLEVTKNIENDLSAEKQTGINPEIESHVVTEFVKNIVSEQVECIEKSPDETADNRESDIRDVSVTSEVTLDDRCKSSGNKAITGEVVNVQEVIEKIPGEEMPVYKEEEIRKKSIKVTDLKQCIEEFLSEDVSEAIYELCTTTNSAEFEKSLNIAKELRESIAATETNIEGESVTPLVLDINVQQVELAQQLHHALSTFQQQVEENLIQMASETKNDLLQRVSEITTKLDDNLLAVISSVYIEQFKESPLDTKSILEQGQERVTESILEQAGVSKQVLIDQAVSSIIEDEKLAPVSIEFAEDISKSMDGVSAKNHVVIVDIVQETDNDISITDVQVMENALAEGLSAPGKIIDISHIEDVKEAALQKLEDVVVDKNSDTDLNKVAFQTKHQEPQTHSLETLFQNIQEYMSENVVEILNEINDTLHLKDIEQSLDSANKFIVSLYTTPIILETVTDNAILIDTADQANLARELYDLLSSTLTSTLEHAEELSLTLSAEKLQKVNVIIENICTSLLVVISTSPVALQILVGEGKEIESKSDIPKEKVQDKIEESKEDAILCTNKQFFDKVDDQHVAKEVKCLEEGVPPLDNTVLIEQAPITSNDDLCVAAELETIPDQSVEINTPLNILADSLLTNLQEFMVEDIAQVVNHIAELIHSNEVKQSIEVAKNIYTHVTSHKVLLETIQDLPNECDVSAEQMDLIQNLNNALIIVQNFIQDNKEELTVKLPGNLLQKANEVATKLNIDLNSIKLCVASENLTIQQEALHDFEKSIETVEIPTQNDKIFVTEVAIREESAYKQGQEDAVNVDNVKLIPYDTFQSTEINKFSEAVIPKEVKEIKNITEDDNIKQEIVEKNLDTLDVLLGHLEEYLSENIVQVLDTVCPSSVGDKIKQTLNFAKELHQHISSLSDNETNATENDIIENTKVNINLVLQLNFALSQLQVQAQEYMQNIDRNMHDDSVQQALKAISVLQNDLTSIIITKPVTIQKAHEHALDTDENSKPSVEFGHIVQSRYEYSDALSDLSLEEVIVAATEFVNSIVVESEYASAEHLKHEETVMTELIIDNNLEMSELEQTFPEKEKMDAQKADVTLTYINEVVSRTLSDAIVEKEELLLRDENENIELYVISDVKDLTSESTECKLTQYKDDKSTLLTEAKDKLSVGESQAILSEELRLNLENENKTKLEEIAEQPHNLIEYDVDKLLQHIESFISEDVAEAVNEISEICDMKSLKESVVIAQELRERIAVLSAVSDDDHICKILEQQSVEEANAKLKLQQALSSLQQQILESPHELSTLSPEMMQKVNEVANNLEEDLKKAAITSVHTKFAEVENSSMKHLKTLLLEVSNKINLPSAEREPEDTESLQDTLDEVQTVIIKLKRDFDGTVNDTLNETLEDLECSVRSVQLQINEDSPPELLKEACATLQLLANNMNETRDVQVAQTLSKYVKADNVLETCSNETDETVSLLDKACKIDTKGSKSLDNIITNLNNLKETVKSLRLSFMGDTETLIEKGVDVLQLLDLIEEKVFSLERIVETEDSLSSSARDSILMAIHSVYGSISNMRGTISSIQKQFMFENYGKPTENVLHSLKLVNYVINGEEELSKQKLKRFSKCLRNVLNHFGDIKFYINLDKTARLPSDAAFTKIVLEELKLNIQELQYFSDDDNFLSKIHETANYIQKQILKIESQTSLEVKDKIPIYKDISFKILDFTSSMKVIPENSTQEEKKIKEKNKTNLLVKEQVTDVQVLESDIKKETELETKTIQIKETDALIDKTEAISAIIKVNEKDVDTSSKDHIENASDSLVSEALGEKKQDKSKLLIAAIDDTKPSTSRDALQEEKYLLSKISNTENSELNVVIAEEIEDLTKVESEKKLKEAFEEEQNDTQNQHVSKQENENKPISKELYLDQEQIKGEIQQSSNTQKDYGQKEKDMDLELLKEENLKQDFAEATKVMKERLQEEEEIRSKSEKDVTEHTEKNIEKTENTHLEKPLHKHSEEIKEKPENIKDKKILCLENENLKDIEKITKEKGMEAAEVDKRESETETERKDSEEKNLNEEGKQDKKENKALKADEKKEVEESKFEKEEERIKEEKQNVEKEFTQQGKEIFDETERKESELNQQIKEEKNILEEEEHEMKTSQITDEAMGAKMGQEEEIKQFRKGKEDSEETNRKELDKKRVTEKQSEREGRAQSHNQENFITQDKEKEKIQQEELKQEEEQYTTKEEAEIKTQVQKHLPEEKIEGELAEIEINDIDKKEDEVKQKHLDVFEVEMKKKDDEKELHRKEKPKQEYEAQTSKENEKADTDEKKKYEKENENLEEKLSKEEDGIEVVGKENKDEEIKRLEEAKLQNEEKVREQKDKDEAEIKKEKLDKGSLEQEKLKQEEDACAIEVKEKSELAESKKKEEEENRLKEEHLKQDTETIVMKEKEEAELAENKTKSEEMKRLEEEEIEQEKSARAMKEKEKPESAHKKKKDHEMKGLEEEKHEQKEDERVKREKEESELAEKKKTDEKNKRLEEEKLKHEEEAQPKKEKEEAEKNEEKRHLEEENLKQKEEAQANSVKVEAELAEKRKKDEEKKRLDEENLKQEEETRAKIEKEEGELAEKKKKGEEKKRLKEEKLKQEEEERSKKEKEEAELADKKKKDEEKKRLEAEKLKQEEEARAKREKEEGELAEKKKKVEEKKRLEEEKLKQEEEARAKRGKEEAEAAEKEEKDEEKKRLEAEKLKQEEEARAKREKEEGELAEKKKKVEEKKRLEEEKLKQEEEARAKRGKEEAEAAEKEEKDEEKKRLEEEKLKQEEEVRSKKEKEEAESAEKKKRDEEKKRLETEKLKQEEEVRSKKEKEEAELAEKKKRDEEKKRLEDEKLKEEEVRSRKEKEEAELAEKKKRDEEKKRLEEQNLKQKEEARAKREKEEAEAAEKEKKNAEKKRLEEEKLQQEEKVRVQQEKEEAEAAEKKKKDEEKKRIEEENLKQQEEARAKREKEEAELAEKKKKDEEKKRLEEEKLKQEEEVRSKKEKEEAESGEKKKKDEEKKRLEEEKLKQEEEARAKRGKEEAEAAEKEKKVEEKKRLEEEKLKQEEEVRSKKEKQEAELAEKKKRDEEKKRLEEEKLKQEEEARAKREKEEAEAAEKEKKDEEKKRLEEEKLKQEEEVRSKKEKEEAELGEKKKKDEEKKRLEEEKLKQEEEARAKREKEEAEADEKEKKDEEKKRLEEEKLKQEEEVRSKKEKQEAESAEKKKRDEEKIRLEEEKLKQEEEARAKREKEEAEAAEKEKKDEEKKRLEEEKVKQEQDARVKREKEEAELAEKKKRDEEKKRLEEEKLKQEEEVRSKKEKEEAELAEKKKRDEEKKRLEEEKLKEEEVRSRKEKEEAELAEKKKRDEEKKRLEEENLKQEEEARAKREKEEAEAAEKEKKNAEKKRLEEEKLQQEEKVRVQQEKQKAEAAEKKKKDEEKKRIEEENLKQQEEARAKREKEEADLAEKKKKDEEKKRLEVKKLKEEEEVRAKKEKEEAELAKKTKRDEEKKRLEEEKLKKEQDAQAKKDNEEAELAEKKKKDEEKKRLEEEKLKLEQDAKANKGKEEAELAEKKKKDEEKKRHEVQKLKQEQDAQAKKEIEDAELAEKKKKDEEKKCLEEEKLKLEQDAQAKKKKTEAGLAEKKKKGEEKKRLDEEKQEKDARAKKEKEEAELTDKKNKNEEKKRLEGEKLKQEDEPRAKKEKEETDLAEKKKKENEKNRLEELKETRVKNQNEITEAEKLKQERERSSKETSEVAEKKKKKDDKKRNILEEERLTKDDTRLMREREKADRDAALEAEKKEKIRQENEASFKKDSPKTVTDSYIQTLSQQDTQSIKSSEKEQNDNKESSRKSSIEIVAIRKVDESEIHNNVSSKSHEQRYIKEYQYEPTVDKKNHDVREKPRFVDHSSKDYAAEFSRPPGYIERRYDTDRVVTDSLGFDGNSVGRYPGVYKAEKLVMDAQLRSSLPPQPDLTRNSEATERREIRQRSKALSEARSVLTEKRSSVPRDIKRKPVFSTFLTDRTAVEGSRVKLTCSVLSSSDPTVTWYRNGIVLNNKLKYRTKFMDGLITLEVLNAVPSDSAEYSCTVENENGSVSSSANLKVYPSFKASPIPPTFTRSIRDTYHMAENELVLECRIRGQPLPTISWLKDDKPIPINERYQAYYLADGVCRLAIDAPTPEDSGKYTCKAENSVWSDQITHVVNFTGKENRLSPNLTTIEKSRFNRQALESRRPHFTNVLSDFKVTHGGTIGLQVEIRGSPTRVEWLREGYNVTDSYKNARTFVEQGLYTLALSDVTEKESGLYTCRAWSSHGTVDMNAAITVVQENELEGKPAMIVGRPEKDVLISVGEDLNISFRVQGEPKAKVIFMKGIRDITNSQRVCKMTSDDYVKFTVKRSVVSDAGTYCILARNAYGCDRAFVTVVIRQRASSDNLISDWTYPIDDSVLSMGERKYKSVPDRIPSEPTVVDGGNNWISLAWPKPDPTASAPVLAYKVESWLLGKEGGARWTELGITPLNSFDAFNLKQGEEYHFRVTTRNRYGWGEAVQTSHPIGIGLSGDRPEFVDILPGQLKVLLGATANLSCSVKGKPTPEVVWMKNGHEIDEEERRMKTSFNGYNCSLVIDDIRIEDEARYSCEASNVHGRASTYARLAVVTDKLIWEADAKLKRERSADVEGDYPPQFTMRLRDRRVQATYPVRLTCQVVGSPPPSVTWYKDGEEVIFDSRHTQSQDEHFHTLEIAPTTLEDGGVYEAMARNTSGAISCHCSLVVDKGIRAYVAPEFCCGLEPLYRLNEGEELRISAVVEAYPSVGVTWYRDGVRLRPSRRAIMTLDRDGQIELALAFVTPRDAGVYTCTASNEVGRASTSGKVEVIAGQSTLEKKRTPPMVISPDVPYSKEPMFIRKPRSSEAHEGDTVIIQCEVVGDPKPDVYWLRDFLKPDYYRDATHFKRVGAGPEYRFEIPHAKLDYTGAYSVVAKNVHGEAKAIISLQILAKDPTVTDDAHNIRYGRVEVIPRFERELTDLLCYDGDAIEFECRVSGHPEPDLRWFHYNELLRENPDFEWSCEDGTARLKIKQVTAEDEGTYTCEAANSLGKATSSACLVVYPPGEPNMLSQRLRRPPALLSAASTPRSTPRSTPARSVSRTPGPDPRRLCSPSRQMAPKFYTYPFNKVVEEGDHVVFQCAVKGLPAPWATWDKDGVIITPSSRITIREKDEILRILEIEQVTIEDVGLYRITLENDYGRVEASARLEVITQKGKFYAGVRSVSASPRKSFGYRRRAPSSSKD